MHILDFYIARLSILADSDAIRSLYLLEATGSPVPTPDLPADLDLLVRMNQAQYIRQIPGRERQWSIYPSGRRMLLGLWESQHGDFLRLEDDKQGVRGQ